jgi:DNA polymerase alpha subunit A
MMNNEILFVLIKDGTNLPATQRAYSIEEFKMPTNTHLKPDVQYYLKNQVHPVVSRLCELLEGVDAVRIADFLGIVFVIVDRFC